MVHEPPKEKIHTDVGPVVPRLSLHLAPLKLHVVVAEYLRAPLNDRLDLL